MLIEVEQLVVCEECNLFCERFDLEIVAFPATTARSLDSLYKCKDGDPTALQSLLDTHLDNINTPGYEFTELKQE